MGEHKKTWKTVITIRSSNKYKMEVKKPLDNNKRGREQNNSRIHKYQLAIHGNKGIQESENEVPSTFSNPRFKNAKLKNGISTSIHE